MPEYHLLPGARIAQEIDLMTILNGQIASYEEIRNYKNSHKDKFKHATLSTKLASTKKVYFLAEPLDLKELVTKIKDGDTLVIHGEGEPFVIGFGEPTKYDLYPHKLVQLFAESKLPYDKAIHLDLKCCHSAADYRGMNFAKDTAVLFGVYGYSHIKVSGYTGLIIEKPSSTQIKFSCMADPFPNQDKELAASSRDRGLIRKTQHCSIKDARVQYNSLGEVISEGLRGHTKPLSDLTKKPYAWASRYIDTYCKGKEEIIAEVPIEFTLLKRSRVSGSSSLFFSAELPVNENQQLVQDEEIPTIT